jgi:exopolysaccharide biosynthesis protein
MRNFILTLLIVLSSCVNCKSTLDTDSTEPIQTAPLEETIPPAEFSVESAPELETLDPETERELETESEPYIETYAPKDTEPELEIESETTEPETVSAVETEIDSSEINDTISYPIIYTDDTCKITIVKEWYQNAWVYAVHIVFTDYNRLGTSCANGVYNWGYEPATNAAVRLDALLVINGCYSAPYLNYIVVRDGIVWNGEAYSVYLPAIYSSNTGLLQNTWESGGCEYTGKKTSELVSQGVLTDSFCFGPPILASNQLAVAEGGSRAQRTFIGTNGSAGDLWLVVSDGRYNDGASAGLTMSECAMYLQSKGCIFVVPLDGGGSSTIVWQGAILNAVEKDNQRAVVDFVYFK